MARFGKSPYICPFCSSGTRDHKLKVGAGGYSIHMSCWKCGCLGPKVRVAKQDGWQVVAYPDYKPEIAQQARELFYGESDPVPSTRVPTFQ